MANLLKKITGKITKENLKPKNLFKNFVEYIHKTPSEILILGVAGAMIGLGIGHHYESYREERIPLGFSEITQIRRDAQARGEEVTSRTLYLAPLNDMVMKVFECSNEAHKNSLYGFAFNKKFAQELEMRIEPTFKFHTNDLNDFLKSVPVNANLFLESLAEHAEVMKNLPNISQLFNKTWDDYHVDNYHTETRTYDCGTSDNPQTCTETIQVYDDTDHSYYYHPEFGQKASIALDKLIMEHKNLSYNEKAQTTIKTNAEGEMASEVSREKSGEHLKLNQGELIKIANTWHYGSTLTQNLGKINSLWSNLQGDANSWRKAKTTAHNEFYTTYSHYDSGPAEFQVAESTINHGNKLKNYIEEIISGVNQVKNKVPALESKVKELIGVELDNKPGNSRKLAKEIMNLSQEMYKANFKEGFDVDGYRGWMVGLSSLLGLLSGGLIGFGIDCADNKWNIYFRNRKFE